MKIFKRFNKQLIFVLHLLFWFISINAWSVVFSPGVDSDNVIKGLQDYWPTLLLINGVIYLICLAPFIWLSKRTWTWVKICITIIFLVPVSYAVYFLVQPDSPSKWENLSFITDYLIASFGYVVVFHLTIVLAVYFNLKVLFTRFLNQSKYFIYLLSIFGLTGTAAVVNFAIFDWIIDKIFPNLYFISYYKIWELAIIIGAYLIFTTCISLIRQYNHMLITNREKAQNELSALKAQINPHFLFNNLNTIYSMASKNDVRTKDVILKLSDFLRYVLYDTTNESIPLEKEVEIIRKYVDLQRERVNPSNTQIILTTEGDFESLNISPLLLLPLAENCFKHGIGKKTGKIHIYIGLKGKQLIFTTENPVALREKTESEESGGIGINNVENRLNLLYPNRYTLHFEDVGGIFKVELKVEL